MPITDKELRQLQRGKAAWRVYAEDLKRRHDEAVDALASLARGCGCKVEGADWTVAMRKLAGDRLAEISKMPLRVVK